MSRNTNNHHKQGADIKESPYMILAGAAFLALVCAMLSFQVAIRQPWLGLKLQVDEDHPGVFVKDVQARSPADMILLPGDSILSVRSSSGRPFILEPSDLVEDPDVFQTFQGYNSFLERQGVLAGILSEPVVELSLADGRKVKIQPAAERPWSSLPSQFWLLNFIGIIVFLIGAGVWAVRRESVPVRMFFCSGLGLLITGTTMAVIVSRELALDPGLLATVRGLYHVGNNIFSTFGIGLLFHYPSLLGYFPMTRVIAVLTSFFFLNEQFQWTDIPGHTVFFQPVLYFIIGASVGILQWRRSKGRPVDRAALKWFMIAFFGCIGFAFIIYFIPAIFTGETVVPISVGLGSVALMYIGLALGILRYRLFDIDRWWFGFWLWFLAGASVLAIDGILAFTVIRNRPVALAVAVILVGWLYFPARQWVWGRLYGSPENRLERSLPALLAGLVDTGRAREEAWNSTMRDVFLPLSIKRLEGPLTAPGLEKHGEVMLVPSLDGAGSIELHLADRGGRLFHRSDVDLAKVLHEVARNTEDRLAVYNRGVKEERERIMRDLHDEVGGRLLSLVHAKNTPRNTLLARNALKALRDIIYSIKPSEEVTIEEVLATWRYEFIQRCEDAGVAAHWEDGVQNPRRLISPRQMVDLSRVLFEATTNAFVHASPRNIWVTWDGGENKLACVIRNDGTIPGRGEIRLGKGIRNMEMRAGELGGQCRCEALADEGLFEVRLEIPLTDGR